LNRTTEVRVEDVRVHPSPASYGRGLSVTVTVFPLPMML
jgi:hypothetical protein